MTQASKPLAGTDYVSLSGRKWRWCDVRECWRLDSYKYLIYPVGGEFVCSTDHVWQPGNFSTFEEAEKAVIE